VWATAIPESIIVFDGGGLVLAQIARETESVSLAGNIIVARGL